MRPAYAYMFALLCTVFMIVKPALAQEKSGTGKSDKYPPLQEYPAMDGVEDESSSDSSDSENSSDATTSSFLQDTAYDYGGFLRQGFDLYKRRTGPTTRTDDITSSSRIRLYGQADNGPYRFRVSGNADLVFTNHEDSPVYAYLYKSMPRNRTMSLERVHDEHDYVIRTDIHRMFFAYRTLTWDITIGRQAISWGQTRFLNPMDLITPLGIFIQDIEDVPGADAISATYYINSYDSVQVVILPMTRMDERDMSELKSEDSTAIVRYKGTFFDSTDIVFLGGRHYRSWVVGTEASVDVSGASLRFAYLGRREDEEFHDDPQALKPVHQVAVGASYAFFKGELMTTAEFFYNSGHYDDDPSIPEAQQNSAIVSAGFIGPFDEDRAFFRSSGRILTRNPWFFQFSAGGEVLDNIMANLFLIWDVVGKSAIYGPQISYDFSDEGTFIIAGRLYAFGHDRSRAEFAQGDPQAFAFLRWHF